MSNYPIVSEATEAGATLPWERQDQEGETSKQFQGFCSYKNANPAVRSLAKVARALGYSKSYAERLSREHYWVRRAAAWDEERDRQRQTRLFDHMEELEKHHLRIADLALKTITKRLENLDPKDLPIAQIPRLLEAVARAQELLFPAPAEVSQPGQVMHARELRIHLKELGVLNTFAPSTPSPPAITPQLQNWLDGKL